MLKFNFLKSTSNDVVTTKKSQGVLVERAQLMQHIADLERELAAYVAKYGLTDESRRLFFKRKL